MKRLNWSERKLMSCWSRRSSNFTRNKSSQLNLDETEEEMRMMMMMMILISGTPSKSAFLFVWLHHCVFVRVSFSMFSVESKSIVISINLWSNYPKTCGRECTRKKKEIIPQGHTWISRLDIYSFHVEVKKKETFSHTLTIIPWFLGRSAEEIQLAQEMDTSIRIPHVNSPMSP